MRSALGAVALALLVGLTGWTGAEARPWRSELHDAPKARARALARHRASLGLPPASAGADGTTDDFSPPPPPYNQSVAYFQDQVFDHFNLSDTRTFGARYFVIDTYFDAPDGPVILNVCGEYTCPGLMPARLFPLEIAQAHGAMVVTLEARFYGLTQPFQGNNSVSALSLLNSRQHVEDLATFAAFLQASINANYSRPAGSTNKMVVTGGSYPGALTSWFRLKYPFLTVGAHSSSGVVLAVQNYTWFDHQVYWSAGDECAAKLQAVTAAAMSGNLSVWKAALGASTLRDDDFFFLMADGPAEGVQYGHRDVLCDVYFGNVSASDPAGLFDAHVAYMNEFFYAEMGNDAAEYDTTISADPVLGGDGRSWWWQTCGELGYFQIAPQGNDLPPSIRSSWVNESYYTSACQRIFQPNMPSIAEAVANTNLYYGGNHTGAAPTVWDQGVQDPWQWAGVRTSLAPDLNAIVVDCDPCAHCSTLYTPRADDPAPLQEARDFIRAQYDEWFA
jgi:Serine carboxypeptidase S28